jgi:hypothetical protein
LHSADYIAESADNIKKVNVPVAEKMKRQVGAIYAIVAWNIITGRVQTVLKLNPKTVNILITLWPS